MNFDDINKIYAHLRDNIYPYVKTVWNTSTEDVLVDKYLSVIDDARKYQLICVPYLFNAELFFKKYYDNCIIFYNTVDPTDGLMLTIHQINPGLHVSSRLFCWVENGQSYDYLSSLLFYKNYTDAVDFIVKNEELKRVGNTEETKAGFAGLMNGFSAGKQNGQ
jgi:hypothetical protein